MWGDGDRFTISDAAGACRIAFRHPGASPLARAVLAECAMAELAAGARALVDAQARPRAVELSHAPLGDTTSFAAHLGVAPAFGCGHTSVVFGPEVADRPLSFVRDRLARALEEQCQRVVDALPNQAEFARRVRGALRELIERSPTLPGIARRLGTSARTLQRRLAREGTSFHELLDLERRARADELIGQGAAFKEAAYRVGYADPSALARARRRWLGRA